jgi:hypothetical protein
LFYDFTDMLDSDAESDIENENELSVMGAQIANTYESNSGYTSYESIDSMIQAIMNYIPSDTGAINEYEFFAECFRKFILEPESLTQNNINMIVNTFNMTRGAGKEVIMAHKLLRRYVELIVN